MYLESTQSDLKNNTPIQTSAKFLTMVRIKKEIEGGYFLLPFYKPFFLKQENRVITKIILEQ